MGGQKTKLGGQNSQLGGQKNKWGVKKKCWGVKKTSCPSSGGESSNPVLPAVQVVFAFLQHVSAGGPTATSGVFQSKTPATSPKTNSLPNSKSCAWLAPPDICASSRAIRQGPGGLGLGDFHIFVWGTLMDE